jgi:hypothetical protein
MNPHLRSEKNCLNCGARVEERYCSHCGQENVEIRESFGHLISHLISDLTHYDSKLFTTLKDLLFKPGFLTNEYLAGRRITYLHPIRMYVFVSFLYFLVILSFNNFERQAEESIAKTAAQDTRKQIADSLRKMLSAGQSNATSVNIKDSTVRNIIAQIDTGTQPHDEIIILNIDYDYLVAFDSAQRLLPEQKRAKGLMPWVYHHWLNTINLYGKKGMIYLVRNRTEHFVPKMMFFLLPLFALILKLFYDRKKYLYTDHLIFSLHFHTAVFLIFLFFSIISLIFPALSKDAESAEYILTFIYLGLALRKIYGQTVFITTIKVIGITVLYTLFIVAGYIFLVVSALL